MNVAVINLDGTTTNYGYSPERKAHVVGFYTKAYWAKEIKSFTMTHDDGNIISIGA